MLSGQTESNLSASVRLFVPLATSSAMTAEKSGHTVPLHCPGILHQLGLCSPLIMMKGPPQVQLLPRNCLKNEVVMAIDEEEGVKAKLTLVSVTVALNPPSLTLSMEGRGKSLGSMPRYRSQSSEVKIVIPWTWPVLLGVGLAMSPTTGSTTRMSTS